MPNSPIGGVSFLINGFILLVGRVVNKISGKPKLKCIISQSHIMTLESTHGGVIFSRALTYALPVILIAIIGAMSVTTLRNLFQDPGKVTPVEGVRNSAEGGYALFDYIMISGSSSGASTAVPLGILETVASGSLISAEMVSSSAVDKSESGGSSNFLVAIIGVDVESDLSTSSSNTEAVNSVTSSLLYANGMDLGGLVQFMKANKLSVTYESRQKYALMYGVVPYQGTALQNSLLRTRLGVARISD